jgi:hypothetical protein
MAGAGVEIRSRLDVDEELEWWRPLAAFFVAGPHAFVAGVLAAASLVVMVAIGVAVLVTCRVPQRLAAFQVMTVRERVRAFSYFFSLRRSAPPFTFAVRVDDQGDDPLTELTVTPAAHLPRWSLFVRIFVLLPHLAVLLPIAVVLDLCYPVWMVLASISRGWPPSLARTLVAIERWVAALAMYGLLVVERPPAFGFAAYGDRTDDYSTRSTPSILS